MAEVLSFLKSNGWGEANWGIPKFLLLRKGLRIVRLQNFSLFLDGLAIDQLDSSVFDYFVDELKQHILDSRESLEVLISTSQKIRILYRQYKFSGDEIGDLHFSNDMLSWAIAQDQK